MLERFAEIWSMFADISNALPADIITVVCTVFCMIGIVGVLRTV